MPGPVRDVVFDLGGVLVDWDPRHLLCGRLGFTAAEAEDFLEHVCSFEWHAGIDAGRSFEAACEALIREHPAHADTIRAYAERWPEMFAGDFASSVRVLEALKRSGFRVHALSNYPASQIAFLYRRYPFMREFDTVIVSGLVGSIKPDAHIFEYLIERIGTRDCVFFDDREDNVEAARRAGIRGVVCARRPTGALWKEWLDATCVAELSALDCQ